MKDFNYNYKTKVLFGSNRKEFLKELANYGNKVLLTYGGGSIKRNGIYDEIIELLHKANKSVIEFNGIMSNPTYTKAKAGAKLARENDIDLIVAVGGGSVIDCSKVISTQAMLDEDIWDMEYQKGIFPTKGIPLFAIVTALGTGAEMNGGAVITYEEKNWKGGLFATVPTVALLDPKYTLTLHRMQVFSGAYDTFSHALETYLGTSDKDNVSDEVALAIMKNTVTNIRRLIENIDDIEARSNLMWDSAMAENGILKCGRLTDFQVHQIEHQLGAYTDCNHGQGLAVIQPIYLRFIMNEAKEKLDKLAKVVFDKDLAIEGIEAIETLIKDCELPTKLSQLRSTVEINDDLLKEVANTSNIIKSNPKNLTKEDIYNILLECK